MEIVESLHKANSRAYMAKPRWAALELYRYPPKPKPEPQYRHTISEPLKGKKTKQKTKNSKTKTKQQPTQSRTEPQLAPPVTVTTEPREPDSYAVQLSSPQAVAHPENEVPWDDSHVLTVCRGAFVSVRHSGVYHEE